MHPSGLRDQEVLQLPERASRGDRGGEGGALVTEEARMRERFRRHDQSPAQPQQGYRALFA